MCVELISIDYRKLQLITVHYDFVFIILCSWFFVLFGEVKVRKIIDILVTLVPLLTITLIAVSIA